VLALEHNAGRIVFVGGSGYTVQVDRSGPEGICSVVRSGSTAEMWSWLNGFRWGQELSRPEGWWSSGPPGIRELRLANARAATAAMRELVVFPSLTDQLRMLVVGAMEARGLNFTELAELVGRGPQSVRDALHYGRPNPARGGVLQLFEDLLVKLAQPLEVRFPLRPERAEDLDVLRYASGPRVEPAGVAWMRAMVIAAERRLIDDATPTTLQRARRARDFTIRVAGHDVVRPHETLIHWLRGVADGAGDVPGMVALELA
jgi:hypothetical protein